MDIGKIQELLQERFSVEPNHPKKRHIIFWYDNDGTFKDELYELNLKNVKILKIEKELNKKEQEIYTNIFKIKYEIEILDLNSNFLIYSEHLRPDGKQNYLLDIERYSEQFKANKTTMLIEEFSFNRLDYDIVAALEKYEPFFGNKERREQLKKLLNLYGKDIKTLELGILAVLCGNKSLDFEDILKDVILNIEKVVNIKKWMGLDYLFNKINEYFKLENIDNLETFLRILCVVHFYKEMEIEPHLNLKNYYVGNKTQIYLFVDSILQNKNQGNLLKEKFFEIGKDLNFKERINELGIEKSVLGTGFEYFDCLLIKEIIEKLEDGLVDFTTYRKYINARLDITLWKNKYLHTYISLLKVIDIFQYKEELNIDEFKNIKELYDFYTGNGYKIDRMYREFYCAYDRNKGQNLDVNLDSLEEIISIFYEKEFLESLLNEWSENLNRKHYLPLQKDFYKTYIEKSDTRVAVIVSDALRYEIGTEIREKLLKRGNNQEVSLCGMLTSLPSITSLGMSNLLPFSGEIKYTLNDRKIKIKNIDTRSTENRELILKLAEENSCAIQFDIFKNMSRSSQEEYIKGKKVIYIYHDIIDAMGDKGKTESRTFEACETAVDDITSMTMTLSSLGVVNTVITSDHGFLYERKEIQEYDKLEFKNEYSVLRKRYALSLDNNEERGCITLKLGEYFGVFPKKNQRIKTQGNGLQFVHGGLSPQEMIVPVIRYRSGSRSSKSRKVQVKLRGNLGRITSNLVKFGVYQIDRVNISEKVIGRDITLALYTLDGIKVSTEENIKLNSKEENSLYTFRLTLKEKHEKLILKAIDKDTEEVLDLKEYEVRLNNW